MEKQTNEKRYIIVDVSKSCHCCFEYTIIDTFAGKRESEYEKDERYLWEKSVCECFELEDAELICEMLNKTN